MTKDELDAIRARFDSGLSLEYDETEALLAEVERLRALVLQNGRAATVAIRERDAKTKQNVALIGQNGRLQLEVERLTAERAALQVGDTESTTLEANERFAPSEHVVVYIEKWCDGSGPCAVELEPHGHWRLSRSVSLASVRKAERDAAFQRGVAAMREAAAKELDRLLTKRKATAIWVGPDELRALPDPEDKS